MEWSRSIWAYRKAHGLTQGQFAELIDVDERYVRRWEKNEIGVSRKYLDRLRKIVKMPDPALETILALIKVSKTPTFALTIDELLFQSACKASEVAIDLQEGVAREYGKPCFAGIEPTVENYLLRARDESVDSTYAEYTEVHRGANILFRRHAKFLRHLSTPIVVFNYTLGFAPQELHVPIDDIVVRIGDDQAARPLRVVQ